MYHYLQSQNTLPFVKVTTEIGTFSNIILQILGKKYRDTFTLAVYFCCCCFKLHKKKRFKSPLGC